MNDGFPTIEENCILGAGAKVFGKINCGSNSVIGANAVVTSNIDPWSLVKVEKPLVLK